MIEAILVVLTKAVPGRDDDLNDWYTNIHIRDALRFRGSITAQRFKRSENQVQTLTPDFDWQYLALYDRSEEHTSELQSLMRISYAVFCLKKQKKKSINISTPQHETTR